MSSSWKRASSGFLTTKHVYTICRSDFHDFRGSRALIFAIFFFNRPRILRGFHFFALERPIKKSDGRTACTTASTTVCMNTGRFIGGKSAI